MTPENVSHILRQVSTYIENNHTPDKGLIISALSQVFSGLESYAHMRANTAADPRKFTKSEFDDVDSKMNDFIERLEKVTNSLNPQDPSKVELDGKVEAFRMLQNKFQTEFKGMNVSV